MASVSCVMSSNFEKCWCSEIKYKITLIAIQQQKGIRGHAFGLRLHPASAKCLSQVLP